MRRYVLLAAGTVAAVVTAVGIAGVAAQTGGGDDGGSGPVRSFMQRLAANLGIEEDELGSAIDQTADEMIDDAVANGDISPERGEALKKHDLGGLLQRLDDGRGFDFGGVGPGKGEDRQTFRHALVLGRWLLGGALSEAADIIGIDVRTLLVEMADGKTLAEVAADHGVSREALKQGLLDEYSADLDELLDRPFEFPRLERDDEPSGAASPTATATPGS